MNMTSTVGFQRITTVSVLNLPPSAGNPRNSEGAFARLATGRLIYVYSRYNGQSWRDHERAELALRYSDDDGRSWSSRDVIVRHCQEDGRNLMSVSLLSAGDGRLLLSCVQKSRGADGRLLCRPEISTVDPETLRSSSAKPLLDYQDYYVAANDRLVRLSTGRILLPVCFHRTLGRDERDLRGVCMIFASDDEGRNFHELPGWLLPPQGVYSGLQEPGLVELSDGRWLFFARTSDMTQYTAVSGDGGNSWSIPTPAPEFTSPLSPMNLKRDPFTGNLVAVWNDLSPRWAMPDKHWIPGHGWADDSSAGRTPLVMAESTDDGRSWRNFRLLENDPECGFCYVALFFTAEAFLLGYCCGGHDGLNMLQASKLVRVERN